MKYPKTTFSIIGLVVGLALSFYINTKIGFNLGLAEFLQVQTIILPVVGFLVGLCYGYIKYKIRKLID